MRGIATARTSSIRPIHGSYGEAARVVPMRARSTLAPSMAMRAITPARGRRPL
ncbi:MAG: hypothetical protein Q4G04_06010 [bacterium]|nr:hypothetical protein [bacterium]